MTTADIFKTPSVIFFTDWQSLPERPDTNLKRFEILTLVRI
jgi:hypothetical protein